MSQSGEVISHWHHCVEGLSTSTQEFYAAVERELHDKEVPELRLERVEWRESGLLTRKREYLRVGLGRLSFDICGAPFGKDFFFSWWLTRRAPSFAALYGCGAFLAVFVLLVSFVSTMGFLKGIFFGSLVIVVGAYVIRGAFAEGWSTIEDTILAIPYLGVVYVKLVRPTTYYSEDTRLMFEDAVHRVVSQVVAGILALNRLPEIPSQQLRPKSRGTLS